MLKVLTNTPHRWEDTWSWLVSELHIADVSTTSITDVAPSDNSSTKLTTSQIWILALGGTVLGLLLCSLVVVAVILRKRNQSRKEVAAVDKWGTLLQMPSFDSKSACSLHTVHMQILSCKELQFHAHAHVSTYSPKYAFSSTSYLYVVHLCKCTGIYWYMLGTMQPIVPNPFTHNLPLASCVSCVVIKSGGFPWVGGWFIHDQTSEVSAILLFRCKLGDRFCSTEHLRFHLMLIRPIPNSKNQCNLQV